MVSIEDVLILRLLVNQLVHQENGTLFSFALMVLAC